jgi:hypothetical protein
VLVGEEAVDLCAPDQVEGIDQVGTSQIMEIMRTADPRCHAAQHQPPHTGHARAALDSGAWHPVEEPEVDGSEGHDAGGGDRGVHYEEVDQEDHETHDDD